MKTIEKEQIQANSLRNQRGPPLVVAACPLTAAALRHGCQIVAKSPTTS